MNNLHPEQRMDVNGKIVTRHVKSSVESPIKKLPPVTSSAPPMMLIDKHLSRLVSPMALKQTFSNSSPRQQVACRDALVLTNRGPELIGVAVQRGNNAALAGTLGALSDDRLFSDEKSATKRYEKFLSAARDAHLIGGVGVQGESMNLAEARPDVKEKVREFVYLCDAAESSGGKVDKELAKLALDGGDHSFEDVYGVVKDHGVTDAAAVRSMLEA